MAYTSTTATLAILEFLAHIETSSFEPAAPPELVVVTAEIDGADITPLATLGTVLPEDWKHVPGPADLRAIGDGWIASGRSVGLAVPSALLPDVLPERNILINPVHPRFATVTWRTDAFEYDVRLVT